METDATPLASATTVVTFVVMPPEAAVDGVPFVKRTNCVRLAGTRFRPWSYCAISTFVPGAGTPMLKTLTSNVAAPS